MQLSASITCTKYMCACVCQLTYFNSKKEVIAHRKRVLLILLCVDIRNYLNSVFENIRAQEVGGTYLPVVSVGLKIRV